MSLKRIVCFAISGLGIASHVSASDSVNPYQGVVSVVIENDFFTGSDNNYTNGIGFSWTSAEVKAYDSDSFVRQWTDFWSFLPVVGEEGSETYVSWTLGQEMHTPDDITDPNPPIDDQPYAGVLYLDSTLYTRRERWHHIWSLRLGVVGPSSGAESTQREFHKLIGADEPKGWDTQLPNEPIINVTYTVGYLLSHGKLGSASWRLVPIGSASLGNYVTSIGGGAYTEIGWNLPRALGLSTLRSGLNTALTAGAELQDSWSVSFFAGGAGMALRIIFRWTEPFSEIAAQWSPLL